MDDNPNNQTQNELIQNNNDEKTSENSNPPQIEDNNIPQKEIQNNNNINQTQTNNNPPQIEDNNIPQEEMQNNNNAQNSTNYIPPQIDNNNIPQQEEMQPSENSSEHFPPPQPQNLSDIYDEPNIPNPESQDLNNPAPKSNPDSNKNDNQLYVPPIIPISQIVEEKQPPEEYNFEIKEQNSSKLQERDENVDKSYGRECCLNCCEEFCDKCCDCYDKFCMNCEKCCGTTTCDVCFLCCMVFWESIILIFTCCGACGNKKIR